MIICDNRLTMLHHFKDRFLVSLGECFQLADGFLLVHNSFFIGEVCLATHLARPYSLPVLIHARNVTPNNTVPVTTRVDRKSALRHNLETGTELHAGEHTRSHGRLRPNSEPRKQAHQAVDPPVTVLLETLCA